MKTRLFGIIKSFNKPTFTNDVNFEQQFLCKLVVCDKPGS